MTTNLRLLMSVNFCFTFSIIPGIGFVGIFTEPNISERVYNIISGLSLNDDTYFEEKHKYYYSYFNNYFDINTANIHNLKN
ncbi:MAG: hypothetical protein EB135_03305 [Proteobacteria bacterium]|nr:hypothetical protein [Pseudomonadota bacterium]